MGLDVTRSRKRQLYLWTSLALIHWTFLTGPNSEAAQPAEKSPPPLDLSDYKVTFEDDFNTMDIVADGGNGRWFAPVHSPVGGARFLAPGRNGPFFFRDGFLTIRAENKDGRWQSGFMQSVDSKG